MEAGLCPRGRSRSEVIGRAVWLAAAAGLGLIAAALSPGRAWAQSGIVIEARAGVVFSTPLVEGTVAFPDTPAGDSVQTFEVAPTAAPMLTVAGRTALEEGLSLELAAGWSFSRVEGRQGEESWELRDVGIGHAVLGLRQRLWQRFHVRGGLGLIRYGAGDGLFEGGRRVRPLLEIGAGAELDVGAARVTVTGVGQAHSFGSAAIRGGAGSGVRGADGTVYRIAVQVGVALGEGAP